MTTYVRMNPPVSTAGSRLLLLVAFALSLAFAQVRETLRPDHAAKLRITVKRSDTGETVPARVYLFKGDRPFRLSPMDALLPLNPDLFYRERLWRRNTPVSTLEVTGRGESHFFLLDGAGEFDLPAAADYRLEAYHGTFFKPAVARFALRADQTQTVELEVEPLAAGRQDSWISADDHIHLMRAKEDNNIFLRWIEAEDLDVAHFLELERQQYAAVQYAFGDEGEARRDGQVIRSGHESRSRFYGHTLFLGPRKMIRPLSIGLEYANSPEAYPNPLELFSQGRAEGALTGFAHFYGSQPNSTLLLNLVHESIDFVEVFQFGVLKTVEWYELLNAGFRVVGLAGSDFPANIGRFGQWPRALPLLGPERALTPAVSGEPTYRAWERGVREGSVLLTNGPLLEFEVNGESSGAQVSWDGDSHPLRGQASVVFHRPIESLEVVRNGQVIARQAGDGTSTELSLEFESEITSSAWIAARAVAQSLEGEPPIQAHTNPLYLLRDGKPIQVESARRALSDRWNKEARYYRDSPLVFSDSADRERLLARVDRTTEALRPSR